MSAVRSVFRRFQKIAIVICSILLFAGCTYAPYYANRAAGGGTDAAEGEQHDVPYTVNDSFVLTQDVLRGEGILFEVKPDDKLVTLWKDADVGPGVLGSLVGKHPQYRYEIEVVEINPRSSRIIVNVRVEDIPDEDLAEVQCDDAPEPVRQVRPARRAIPAVGRHSERGRRQLRAAAERGPEGSGETGDRQRGQLAANRAGQRPPVAHRRRQSAKHLDQEHLAERAE